MSALDTSEKVFDGDAINPMEMQCTPEKCDSKIVETISEECEKKILWSELPSLPLEKIYSFLSRADQVNMSLVCRKWSEGYGSPSVWKTFRFALTESELSMKTCPIMKFVRKYSSMFQNVEINCPMPSRYGHKIKAWCRHLLLFFRILSSNAQLISVCFRDSLWCLSHIDTVEYEDLCRAIANFLGSQCHLKRVEFHDCPFKFPKFVEFLKELTKNSRESLTHIVLRGFVRYKTTEEEQDSTIPQILLMLTGLPNLRAFETDYSLIFENIFVRQFATMETLKNYKMRVFSKIILYYDNNSIKIEDFRRLTSTDWQFLKKLYPNLQVVLNVTTNSPSRREMEFLIVANMPITHLNYTYDDFHWMRQRSSVMEIDIIFDRLLACKTIDNLVSLHLKWGLPIQDLVSTFVPFFQACKKLKSFQLSTVYPVNGIDLLMEYWLVNRPQSLEKVLIDISDIENKCDYAILMCLVAKYVSRLELLGLNVKVDLTDNRQYRDNMY